MVGGCRRRWRGLLGRWWGRVMLMVLRHGRLADNAAGWRSADYAYVEPSARAVWRHGSARRGGRGRGSGGRR